MARFSGVPSDAAASAALAGPRSTCATPTAMTAPATVPGYVAQVTAIGPLGLEYLDPEDDPRNA
jgi:hypothetical protein